MKMLSPGFRKVLDKILFICSNTGVYNNYYCSLIKMSQPKWQTEKYRLLKMTPDDRKKAGMYDNKTVVTVNMVDPWKNYVIRNKHIEKERIHNNDDLTEFMKIKIDPEQNKELSQRVSIFRGDITQLEVSAIVNAANSMLRAGGGVDGAIHRAAGPLLQDECNTLKGCPTGEAKITCGYNLPATYVIHTVGPQDGNAEKLAKCYENSLAFHKTHKLTSIAFPCISTGIYGFPNRLAAHIALKTARKFLEQNPEMERIIFCLFMPIDVEIYEALMQIYFPVHEWNHPDDVRQDTETWSLQDWDIIQPLYGEGFTGVPYITGPDLTGDWVDLHHPYKPKNTPLRPKFPLSEREELVNIVKEVENNAVSSKSPTTNIPPSLHLWAISSPPLMFLEEDVRKSTLLYPTRPTLNVTRDVHLEPRQSVQATTRRARKRTRRLSRRNFKEQQHRDNMILLREKNRIRTMKIQVQKDWQANVKKALHVIEKMCKSNG